VRRLIGLAGIAVVLLAACGGNDRPEGMVERWLVSLNQGKAGRPDTYAPAALNRRILPHWRARDPGALDVIEVGKGRSARDHGVVPFRIERTSGVKMEGVVQVFKPRGGDWRVRSISRRSEGLRVPSEGGPRIGNASAATWGAAIGISAALMLLVALFMRLMPSPIPLPTTTRQRRK
jgi:hypothetical protein